MPAGVYGDELEDYIENHMLARKRGVCVDADVKTSFGVV